MEKIRRMSFKNLTAVILIYQAIFLVEAVDIRSKDKTCDKGFWCGDKSTKCYYKEDRCDGKSTCFNNADEKNCTADQCGPHRGLFLCDSGRCIYETWMCDNTDDCEDSSDELDCSGSTTRVIIAAVVGSLICSLLLVVVLGCTCKLYLLGARDTCRRHSTPLSRLQVEIMGRRAPPPSYNEAMLTSRPFDEVRREILLRQSASGGEINLAYQPDHSSDSIMDGAVRNNIDSATISHQRTGSESNSDSETSGCDNTNDVSDDDDELLDLGDDSDVHIQMSDDVNLLAAWHSTSSLPVSEDISDDTQLLDLSDKKSKDCDKSKLTSPATSSTSTSSSYAHIPPQPAPTNSTSDSQLPSNSTNTSPIVNLFESQSHASDSSLSVCSDSVPLLDNV